MLSIRTYCPVKCPIIHSKTKDPWPKKFLSFTVVHKNLSGEKILLPLGQNLPAKTEHCTLVSISSFVLWWGRASDLLERVIANSSTEAGRIIKARSLDTLSKKKPVIIFPNINSNLLNTLFWKTHRITATSYDITLPSSFQYAESKTYITCHLFFLHSKKKRNNKSSEGTGGIDDASHCLWKRVTLQMRMSKKTIRNMERNFMVTELILFIN